ncbi:MAG: AraC family ligand binding domain-containing protein, partial [Lachnospiraceae bacterium]|nr:AraC family ligand binding domain-containing protein [Lachnospiraceae bacterium]
MFQMKLDFFTTDETFPFCIQYGTHEEDLYLHSHENFLELVIVLNGSALHTVNDEEFYISKGDVFVMGADTFHGYHNTKDFHICNLMFQPDFFFEGNCDIKKAPGFQGLFVIEPILSQKGSFQNRLKLDVYNYEIVRQMIDMMIEEYNKHTLGFKTFLKGSFYTLAVMLSRLYSASDCLNNNDIIGMAKSIAYIENHFMEDLTLSELAEIAGFSPRHFSRRLY